MAPDPLSPADLARLQPQLVRSDFTLTAFPGIKPTERRRVLAARETAYRKALGALSGYKFWMFGYHAAQWVLLNQLVDKADRRGNPFKPLVDVARRMERIEEQR